MKKVNRIVVPQQGPLSNKEFGGTYRDLDSCVVCLFHSGTNEPHIEISFEDGESEIIWFNWEFEYYCPTVCAEIKILDMIKAFPGGLSDTIEAYMF